MTWSDSYLRLPYELKGRTRAGIDCWGVVKLVYWEELGIELPSYADDYVDLQERAEVESLMDERMGRPTWRRVDPRDARPFDMLRFRVGLHVTHVGLVVEPGRRMLHASDGHSSAVIRYNGPAWGDKLACVLRHAEMETRPWNSATTSGPAIPASI